MRLRAQSFTDLLLFADGSAKLKGCPGAGARLLPLPDDCRQEIEGLQHKLITAFFKRGQPAARYHHVASPDDKGITFRVTHIEQGDGKAYFLRRLPDEIPDMHSLGLPPYLPKWLLAREQSMGLVLICGPQTAGKTTFASSFVASRLENHGGHGVTFENPFELPLNGPWGQYGYCFQTDIAGEQGLAEAIEHAHRYSSPEVIFIGEIRTKYAAAESLRVALGSNRQIVVATIHSQDVATALDRLIAWAKELDGSNASQNLRYSLLAAVCLRLEEQDGKFVLASPEHLLLSFRDENLGIRAKLGSGHFHDLKGDMNRIMHRIANAGVQAI